MGFKGIKVHKVNEDIKDILAIKEIEALLGLQGKTVILRNVDFKVLLAQIMM